MIVDELICPVDPWLLFFGVVVGWWFDDDSGREFSVCCQGFVFLFREMFVFDGEFDPGSGRTLAACLTHASRAERPLRGYSSGERVSNT